MIIKKVAVGNFDEAYIEENFNDGVNIVLSDDNNKGKTIMIQSMLYAIGNKPIFPESFEYKKYYYYLCFEHNNTNYEILRKGDSFIIKKDKRYHLIDGISELKQYWTKEIFVLPQFQFQGKNHLANMELFVQMFFVGQDGKNTSNIFNPGYYHKDDFVNMLLYYSGDSNDDISNDDIELINKELRNLRIQRSDKIKLSEFYQEPSVATEYISRIKDKEAFESKVKEMDMIAEKISDLKKERSKAASKRALWNTTLKELNSLNRNIEVGELRCMDCNSTNISYKGQGKNSYSFDVSTPDMRKQIIDSIREKINNFSEDVHRYDAEINEWQNHLLTVMEEEEITLENIVAYKSGFKTIEEIENSVLEIDQKIADLEGQLKEGKKMSDESKNTRKNFFENIISSMNLVRKHIEGNDKNTYNDIFTKRGTVISGSEETVFYISKLLSIAYNTEHNYPIIMDSFRAEDLSTEKEERSLDSFIKLGNQCILTTTIKSEEKGKYDLWGDIHIIDYTDHLTNKLLDKNYCSKFNEILKSMNILAN